MMCFMMLALVIDHCHASDKSICGHNIRLECCGIQLQSKEWHMQEPEREMTEYQISPVMALLVARQI